MNYNEMTIKELKAELKCAEWEARHGDKRALEALKEYLIECDFQKAVAVCR